MAKGATFPKQSFLAADHLWEIALSELTRFSQFDAPASDRRLTKEGFANACKIMGHKVGEYMNTPSLQHETANPLQQLGVNRSKNQQYTWLSSRGKGSQSSNWWQAPASEHATAIPPQQLGSSRPKSQRSTKLSAKGKGSESSTWWRRSDSAQDNH